MQWRRPRFNPWVGKIPWKREWLPTPIFLPGNSSGQGSLAGYSPWALKELDMPEWVTITLPIPCQLLGIQLLPISVAFLSFAQYTLLFHSPFNDHLHTIVKDLFLLLILLLDSSLFLPVQNSWEIEIMAYTLSLSYTKIFNSSSLPTTERINTDPQDSSPNRQVHLFCEDWFHNLPCRVNYVISLMFLCFLIHMFTILFTDSFSPAPPSLLAKYILPYEVFLRNNKNITNNEVQIHASYTYK